VDWYLPSPTPGDVAALRRAIAAHLRRHAHDAVDADLPGAELAVGEILTNAVLHAPGPVWVALDWRGERPRLDVHDLGPGVVPGPALLPDDPLRVGGRGLFLVSHLTPHLEVAAKAGGGTRVSVALPVRRRVARRLDPGPPARDSLPGPGEAGPGGYFPREAFLRALIVQMARSVGSELGPDVVEAMVARVGTDVGARMEDEYRRARELTGPLTPAQIAELLVGLKAAIGGDFWIIAADDEQIVLGNRRCPFGEAVRGAPGLCRMTSSVFGGIAARNAGRSQVVLEERIAVGDPHCRVVVRLRPAAEDPFAHEYSAAARGPEDAPGR